MEERMEITYLGHSGFLAETSDAYYLFDYIHMEKQYLILKYILFQFVLFLVLRIFFETIFQN